MAGGMAKRFLDKYLELEKGIEVTKKTPQTETQQTNSTTQRNVNTDSPEEGRGDEVVNEERETETTSTSEGEEN